MSWTIRTEVFRKLLGSAIFLALTVLVARGFLRAFSPKAPLQRLSLDTGTDYTAMRLAMAPARVREHLDAILANGSRFVGQEGFVKTAQLLRTRMKDAGLDVIEQSILTAVPKTLDHRILDAGGAELPDVKIWPLFPNQFQPMNTSDSGLSGKLVRVSDDVLLNARDFDGCIAVVDQSDLPKGFGTNWTKYAMWGFKAVIVARSSSEGPVATSTRASDRGDELVSMEWNDLAAMADGSQVNFLRLVATPGIFRHLGQMVTLHVAQKWENTDNTTLIGVMHAVGGADEALVIQCAYDAPSVLSDLAPGVLSASSVAQQLALLEGIKSFQSSLKRDVVFVFTASQFMCNLGLDRVISALGPNIDRQSAIVRLRDDLGQAEEQLSIVRASAAVFESDAFFREEAATQQALAALSTQSRSYLDAQVRYVLNSIVFERSEALLQARIPYQLSGETNIDGPTGRPFALAKAAYDEAMNAAGYPIIKLLQTQRKFMVASSVREKAADRLRAQVVALSGEVSRLRQSIGIHDSLGKYRELLVLSPDLLPADPRQTSGESVSFSMGEGIEGFNYLQHPIINNLLLSILRQAGAPVRPAFDSLLPRNHGSWVSQKLAGKPLQATFWNLCSYPSFSLVNSDRMGSYQAFSYPVEKPWMRDTTTIQASLGFLGDTALTMALGAGRFLDPQKMATQSVGGKVFVANVGQSIVPNFPLSGALVGSKNNTTFVAPGFIATLLQFTDLNGRYYLPDTRCNYRASSPAEYVYSPMAVGFGADGLIRLVKDEGGLGQAIYRSNGLSFDSSGNVNIVVFRASPVAVLDLVNPQTLNRYADIEFIAREGLSGFDRRNTVQLPDSVTAFIEPDQFFYVKLKAGAAGNEKAQDTRAFILGTGERNYTPDPQKEIDGPGFLAYSTPILLNVPLRVARSMSWVNQRRLALQNRHGMADDRTNEFQGKTIDFLSKAENSDQPQHERLLQARDAVTYATLNHPVLRESIFEAVIGILWYLALLVPFVFFFEKLAFGFSDIRRQLLAQAVIFLVVFTLLRILHPAFEMIRSSFMILLGFIILLISGGITVLSSGKFGENLEELRKQRGRVTAAEASVGGVVGTAFMLGLNNMHRRRVRTGLTCVTLSLITFAMICFTSVQSDLVDTTTAIGKAPYQGFLIKPLSFSPVSEAEVFALQTRYGNRFSVTTRTLYFGTLTDLREQANPSLELDYRPTTDRGSKAIAKSMLVLGPEDPLLEHIKITFGSSGFVRRNPYAIDEAIPVLIPDKMATKLGLGPDALLNSAMVRINGRNCRVQGVFDSAELNVLKDLDGRNLMPFNIEAIPNVQVVNGQVLADEKDPLMDASEVIIAAQDLGVPVPNGDARIVSAAVTLKDLPYKQAKEVIDTFLEQSQRATYFGLDGGAFLGKRNRESSFAGLLELVIPLIIAALTVLNTMRGSVYERKDEIFVYNAVGIAPKFIFFMFFAEAFVYAVVGSVLGYLLSQGTGRILTELGWTGGLNMTFTSISTILASLAITVSVFVSTLFPALSAKRIAAPANESGWTIPLAEGDTLTFALPFTFDRPDRVAVLAFFRRYFLDHGEGSAGRFRAGDPGIGIVAQATDPDGSYIPQLATTIWLKPFDLGVSQQVHISIPHDPETGEYIATVRIVRLSGTRDAWMRLQKGFLRKIRTHFLHWRAVNAGDRGRLFDEARGLLQAAVLQPEVTSG